ncbi:MAG: hypothetical protein JWP15_2616, partial [Alphaproteobacteria bacterium]|nr:hypothetical protein [Alphaproteobacteria bacterium]
MKIGHKAAAIAGLLFATAPAGA